MNIKLFRQLVPVIILGFLITATQGCKKDESKTPVGGETVTDADNNVYHTVTIGSQVWTVENLRTTSYNDGSPVTMVSDNAAWTGLTTGAYCWYNNDEASFKGTYGALYNWYAVNSGKLAPAGWHVPTQGDWQILIAFLGGDSVAGGRMKASGSSLWNSPNTGADNSSGFSAVPSGSHYMNGSYYLLGKYGWYWSSTESNADEAWHVYMQYNSGAITGKAGSKKDGFSVRLIKG